MTMNSDKSTDKKTAEGKQTGQPTVNKAVVQAVARQALANVAEQKKAGRSEAKAEPVGQPAVKAVPGHEALVGQPVVKAEPGSQSAVKAVASHATATQPEIKSGAAQPVNDQKEVKSGAGKPSTVQPETKSGSVQTVTAQSAEKSGSGQAKAVQREVKSGTGRLVGKAEEKPGAVQKPAGEETEKTGTGQIVVRQTAAKQTATKQTATKQTPVKQTATTKQAVAGRGADQKMDKQASAKSASKPDGGEKKGRPKRKIWIFLLVIIAFIGGAFAWQTYSPQNRMEPNAVVGAMPGKTDEQIQEELNRKVEEKMIAFSINSHPVYPDGKTAGNILFENPSSNNKLTKMELYRDDTGEKIYETGLLRPGSYVPEAKLDKNLEAGDYTCTAYIYAYRLGDETYIGKVAAGITITVQQ